MESKSKLKNQKINTKTQILEKIHFLPFLSAFDWLENNIFAIRITYFCVFLTKIQKKNYYYYYDVENIHKISIYLEKSNAYPNQDSDYSAPIWLAELFRWFVWKTTSCRRVWYHFIKVLERMREREWVYSLIVVSFDLFDIFNTFDLFIWSEISDLLRFFNQYEK